MNNEIEKFSSSDQLPISRSVTAGNFLFLSRHIPIDLDGEVVRGDIEVQTRSVCERIGESLTLYGSDFSQVIKTSVWISDIAHFSGMDKVYREFFEHLPVCLEIVSSLVMDVDVEIEIQAFGVR